LIRNVVREGSSVQDEVVRLRRGFRQLRYCFSDKELERQVEELHQLI
jgi:hypothetical protein